MGVTHRTAQRPLGGPHTRTVHARRRVWSFEIRGDPGKIRNTDTYRRSSCNAEMQIMCCAELRRLSPAVKSELGMDGAERSGGGGGGEGQGDWCVSARGKVSGNTTDSLDSSCRHWSKVEKAVHGTCMVRERHVARPEHNRKPNCRNWQKEVLREDTVGVCILIPPAQLLHTYY